MAQRIRPAGVYKLCAPLLLPLALILVVLNRVVLSAAGALRRLPNAGKERLVQVARQELHVQARVQH